MEIAIILLLLILIGLVVYKIVLDRGVTKKQAETLGSQLSDSLTTTVGERLDSATRVFGDVQRGLGELSQATKQVYEVGKDIASLQDILRAPGPRGGLGELLLENQLAQIFSHTEYELQYRFKSGDTVDAVIRVGQGLVPVDSKFPQESFQRLLDAQTEEQQKACRREFIRNMRKHIDEVSKYILPDEGTFDFALMYIPAENVYYETIIRDEEGDLYTYALKKKVVPVSPNSFYAYLQAIALGLKGLRIEKGARQLLGLLERLQGDFRRIKDDFETLGGHLRHAMDRYGDVERRLGRFEDKLLSAGQAPVAELEEGEEETPD